MSVTAGPRRTGEGTEDEEQGIIAADSTATGYPLCFYCPVLAINHAL